MSRYSQRDMVLYAVRTRHIEISADQAVHAERGDLGDLVYMFVKETLRSLKAERGDVEDQSRAHNGAAGEAASR